MTGGAKRPRRRQRPQGKAKAESGGRASPISDEEARLWRLATRAATPLIRAKSRVIDAAAQGGDASLPRHRIVETARPHPLGPAPGAPPPGASKPAKPRRAAAATKAASAHTGFDRRNIRKIAAGRVDIEARIDLHGMRQREAHAALRRFLFDCVAKGRRTVLVITGKGAAQRGRAGYDSGYVHDGFGGDFEPGVLKRNVPRWLAEADLAAMVVGHTSAHIRHGGEGALYVRLRKRGRS